MLTVAMVSYHSYSIMLNVVYIIRMHLLCVYYNHSVLCTNGLTLTQLQVSQRPWPSKEAAPVLS